MGILFPEDIIKEMDARGPITVSDDYVAGDDFERWLIDRRACITHEYTSSEKDWCESSVEK